MTFYRILDLGLFSLCSFCCFYRTDVAVDEAELAPVMRIVRQGIEAQLRDPAFEYSNRIKLVS